MTMVRFSPGTEYNSDRDPVVASWTAFDVDGCAVEPLGADESAGNGRDSSVSRIRIHIDEAPETPIPLTANVTVRGLTYRVTTVDAWPDEFEDDPAAAAATVVEAQRAIGGGRRG